MTTIIVSPDGRWAVGHTESALLVWELPKWRNAKRIEDPLWPLAFSPNGNLLAVGGYGYFELREFPSFRRIARIAGHNYGVFAGSFSPDGKLLATAGAEGIVKIWDLSSKAEAKRLDPGARPGYQAIFFVRFSARGDKLFSYGDDGAVVYEMAKQGAAFNLRVTDEAPSRGFAVSPDGEWLATGYRSGMIKVWAVGALEEIQTLNTSGWVDALAFSPNGNWLVSSGGQNVDVWQTHKWKKQRSFLAHPQGTFSTLFFAENLLVTSGCDDRIRVWNVTTGHQVASLQVGNRMPTGSECSD